MAVDRWAGPLLDQVAHVVEDVVAELRGTGRSAGARWTPGPPGAPPPDPAARLRLSDAERDEVAEVLRDAYAEGRLDLAEFGERLEVVHAARVRFDLDGVLADLPGPTGAPGRVAAGRPAAGARGADGPELLTVVLREVRRTGAWELPPHLRVSVRGGSAVLDLRGARVRSPVVDIEVRLAGGRIVVVVPDGVPVEVRDGLTVLGSRRSRVGAGHDAPPAARPGRGGGRGGARRGPRQPAGPERPVTRVVVRGEVLAGLLVVRAPTLRERWRSV